MPLVISRIQLQKAKNKFGREEKGSIIIFNRLKKTIYPPNLPIPISPEIMESSIAVSRDTLSGADTEAAWIGKDEKLVANSFLCSIFFFIVIKRPYRKP